MHSIFFIHNRFRLSISLFIHISLLDTTFRASEDSWTHLNVATNRVTNININTSGWLHGVLRYALRVGWLICWIPMDRLCRCVLDCMWVGNARCNAEWVNQFRETKLGNPFFVNFLLVHFAHDFSPHSPLVHCTFSQNFTIKNCSIVLHNTRQPLLPLHLNRNQNNIVFFAFLARENRG